MKHTMFYVIEIMPTDLIHRIGIAAPAAKRSSASLTIRPIFRCASTPLTPPIQRQLARMTFAGESEGLNSSIRSVSVMFGSGNSGMVK